jgi:hypothetical protein
MGIFSRGKKDSPGEPGGSGADAFQLTVQYVKQETLQPLQGLLRYVAFGVLGSLALALGVSLLLLAALRILQTETGAFHGNLSWLPYVIVSALAAVIMVLAAWRITHGAAARRGPAPVPGGASEKE